MSTMRKVTIAWPMQVTLPKDAYEILAELHGIAGLNFEYSSAVRWRHPADLARFLNENRHRADFWTYCVDYLLHVELAAKLKLPFRVFQFMQVDARKDSELEVAAVVEVNGPYRQILWVNQIMNYKVPSLEQQLAAH